MPIDPAKPFDLSFPVTPLYHGCRLDHFVKAMVPSMSRTKIQKYVELHRVLVNGAAQANNWRVRRDDAVMLRCREPGNTSTAAAEIAAALKIIYEDDAIVVVNKAAGIVAHPVGKHRHDTLLNALYWRYRDQLPPEQEVALVNRLDQYTSGVILIAKDTAAKRILQAQFESRRTEKIYYALVRGIVTADHGTIDLPLGPATDGKSLLQAVRLDGAGKAAQTTYEVLERFPDGAGNQPAAPHLGAAKENSGAGISFVSLRPHTGRQHQLRVHLASIGHPLVADQHYGDGAALVFPAADLDAEKIPALSLTRYALHAAALTIIHPRSGARQTFTAPLADDMADALRRLRVGCRKCQLPGTSLESWMP
jgi:23S rRNA pseudouridine1911/1915/1917 synthase